MRIGKIISFLLPSFLIVSGFKYLVDLFKRKEKSLNKTVGNKIDDIESPIKETKKVNAEDSFMNGSIDKNQDLQKKTMLNLDDLTFLQQSGTQRSGDIGNILDYGIAYNDYIGSKIVNTASLSGSIIISPYEDLGLHPEYEGDFVFIGISGITGRGIYKYIGNDFSTFNLPYEEIINL